MNFFREAISNSMHQIGHKPITLEIPFYRVVSYPPLGAMGKFLVHSAATEQGRDCEEDVLKRIEKTKQGELAGAYAKEMERIG